MQKHAPFTVCEDRWPAQHIKISIIPEASLSLTHTHFKNSKIYSLNLSSSVFFFNFENIIKPPFWDTNSI